VSEQYHRQTDGLANKKKTGVTKVESWNFSFAAPVCTS